MERAVKQEQDPSRHAQLQQCPTPVTGRLPCGGAVRAPGARHRALGEGKKREESQDLGSTSKTAAREESLSPKEYKNQWGDEQGSNCKNSNRGKHVEKRGRERMRVGGYKTQTCKEKVLSTAILAYSTSLKEQRKPDNRFRNNFVHIQAFST